MAAEKTIAPYGSVEGTPNPFADPAFGSSSSLSCDYVPQTVSLHLKPGSEALAILILICILIAFIGANIPGTWK